MGQSRHKFSPGEKFQLYGTLIVYVYSLYDIKLGLVLLCLFAIINVSNRHM